MTQSSRPTVIGQARALAAARVYGTDPGLAVLIPHGWRFSTRRKDNNMMLILPDTVTPRLHRVYGYVCACSDSDTRSSMTPYLFNIVLKIPFKFAGDESCAKVAGETQDSWVYARVLAWSSLGCFEETQSPLNSFRHGEPVCGIVEVVNPKDPIPSAMLVGWTFCSFQE